MVFSFLKNKVFLFNLGLLCFNALLVLAVFAKISGSAEFMNVFFCSDTLYLPSIYKDVFIDGNSFEGWHFNAAPNFFPDMLVYFFLEFIGCNFIVASAIYSLLQYSFICYLSGKIFQLLFPGSNGSYFLLLLHGLFSLFLIEALFFSEDFTYSFYLLSNAYHTGSFVMTLLCLYLLLVYMQQPALKHLAALFILISLGTLSDRLFIVSFIAPLVATAILLSKSVSRKKVIILVVLSLLGLWLGLYIFKELSEGNYVYVDQPQKIYDFGNIAGSFKTYQSQIEFYLVRWGFRQVTILLFFLSYLLLAYVFISGYKNLSPMARVYILFSLMFSASVILTPIINGSYISYDNLRYSVSAFFLFPLNLLVVVKCKIKSSLLIQSGRIIIPVLLCIPLMTSVNEFTKSSLPNFLSYYPEPVRTLDSIASQQNFFCGVSNYWDAKKTTLFSKKGLRLYSVHDDFAEYAHVANEKWYYGNNIFNFVFMNGIRDTSFLTKRLKPLRIVLEKKDFKMVEVSPFWYKKEIGRTPVNIGY